MYIIIRFRLFQLYRLENFTAIRQERVSAEKTVRFLKQLLIDIKNLREQVEDSDHEKFDKLVSQSCEKISAALRSYNGKKLILKKPSSNVE